MDGDIAPLADITRLASQHGALVFVDDCHATGFLGAGGRGTDEHCGVSGQVDIINSTLGKALGGATGATLLGSCFPVAFRGTQLRDGCRWLHDWPRGRGCGAAPEGATVPLLKYLGTGNGGGCHGRL